MTLRLTLAALALALQACVLEPAEPTADGGPDAQHEKVHPPPVMVCQDAAHA